MKEKQLLQLLLSLLKEEYDYYEGLGMTVEEVIKDLEQKIN